MSMLPMFVQLNVLISIYLSCRLFDEWYTKNLFPMFKDLVLDMPYAMLRLSFCECVIHKKFLARLDRSHR